MDAGTMPTPMTVRAEIQLSTAIFPARILSHIRLILINGLLLAVRPRQTERGSLSGDVVLATSTVVSAGPILDLFQIKNLVIRNGSASLILSLVVAGDLVASAGLV